jgi:nucleoside-diphosphate-sugar epimerase
VRIVVTGGLGFLGSHLIEALHARGHHLIAIDDCSHNAIYPGQSKANELLIGEVGRQRTYVYGHVDLIIHCASPIGHARLTPEANVAWRIIRDVQEVLTWAETANAKVITFSTSEVLSYRGETDVRAQYALGKLVGESMALVSRVSTQIIRPYNVVGPRQRPDGGFVLARFIEQVATGHALTIFGHGLQRRCFTHVSDLVSFILALIDRSPRGNHVWSVFNPINAVTISGLAAMVALASGGKSEILYDCDGRVELSNPHWRDTREREHPEEEYLRCRELGWEPRVDLEEIIRELLDGKDKRVLKWPTVMGAHA